MPVPLDHIGHRGNLRYAKQLADPVASSTSLKESPRKPCLTARAYVSYIERMAIERHVERELEILTAIEEGVPSPARAGQRLGVALGLTNLY